MKRIIFILLVGIPLLSYSQEWVTSIDEAKDLASENNHHILLVFQGSDWCAPCIKLDHNVWSTSVFKAYAKEHFVMLQADFPKRKKNALPKSLQEHNDMLAERFNPSGVFPLVVILDHEGTKLGETGYLKLGPAAYIDHLKKFL